MEIIKFHPLMPDQSVEYAYEHSRRIRESLHQRKLIGIKLGRPTIFIDNDILKAATSMRLLGYSWGSISRTFGTARGGTLRRRVIEAIDRHFFNETWEIGKIRKVLNRLKKEINACPYRLHLN